MSLIFLRYFQSKFQNIKQKKYWNKIIFFFTIVVWRTVFILKIKLKNNNNLILQFKRSLKTQLIRNCGHRVAKLVFGCWRINRSHCVVETRCSRNCFLNIWTFEVPSEPFYAFPSWKGSINIQNWFFQITLKIMVSSVEYFRLNFMQKTIIFWKGVREVIADINF